MSEPINSMGEKYDELCQDIKCVHGKDGLSVDWYRYYRRLNKWVATNYADVEQYVFTADIDKYLEERGIRGTQKSRMKFLKTYRRDDEFKDKLDVNPDLIGFTNGVYDLAKSKFEFGSPDYCISMSTGYDYESYGSNRSLTAELHDFLTYILPDYRVKEFVLRSLASCLFSHTRHFYIFYGSEGDGRKELIELFQHALGEYHHQRAPGEHFHQTVAKYCKAHTSKTWSEFQRRYLYPGQIKHKVLYSCNNLAKLYSPQREDVNVIPFTRSTTATRRMHFDVEKYARPFMGILTAYCKERDRPLEIPETVKFATDYFCARNSVNETALTPMQFSPDCAPRLVDTRGLINIKNHAEVAYVLSEDRNAIKKTTQIYVDGLSPIQLIVDGDIVPATFTRGIYVEVPSDRQETNKVKCHFLNNRYECVWISLPHFYATYVDK